MSEIISNTFCVLPWVHLATLTDGSLIPCCIAKNEVRMNLHEQTLNEAWNSRYMRNLRKTMLRGERPAACEHCHIEEANGCRSHRTIENKVWTEKMGSTFISDRVKATDADGTLHEPLIAIDLRIGNLCNLQCVMCRPQDSSKWRSMAQTLAETSVHPALRGDWQYKARINHDRFGWYEKPQFLETLREVIPYLRELILGGGEPMLLNEHRWLIEECVRSGAAKNIVLRYHTNGTILPEELFPLWKQFQKVELFVSLDGVGEKNHYMRYPASWPAIEKNLQRLDAEPAPNIGVMILCSVHLMSMYHLANFSDWIERQNFRKVTHGYNGYFHPGVVHYPQYLSVQVYPPAVKAKIAEQLRTFEARSRKPSAKIEGVIGFMMAHDASDRLPQTREYIEKLDRLRGTNFALTFPELSRDLGFRASEKPSLQARL